MDSRTEPGPPEDAPAPSCKAIPPRLICFTNYSSCFKKKKKGFLLHVKPTQLLQSRTAWRRDVLISFTWTMSTVFTKKKKNKHHNKCSAAPSKAVSVPKVQLIAHALFMAQQIRHWSRE